MAPNTATERVRSAIIDGHPPARKDIEHALRETFGLSARQAKRFAAQGARSLAVTEEDALEDLAARLRALETYVNAR